MSWRIGDLAVCVLTQGRPASTRPNDGCAEGRIYRVTEIVSDHVGNVGLVLEGLRSDHPTGGYRACAFRKVIPDGLELVRDKEVVL